MNEKTSVGNLTVKEVVREVVGIETQTRVQQQKGSS